MCDLSVEAKPVLQGLLKEKKSHAWDVQDISQISTESSEDKLRSFVQSKSDLKI